ncbi:MAG: hypothetical protein Q7I98_08660 [Erysipelotrichaceae bacterium]|nr:hypothetical protein [Erysipelotrichaceae bacterium]
MATEAKRYLVKNGNDPTSGNVTEEKESELEEFIDYTKIVMGTFGHKLFHPLVAIVSALVSGSMYTDDEPILYLKKAKANETTRITNEGFVVLKRCAVSANPTKGCPDTIRHLREQFAEIIDIKMCC